ncbi:hypothetical protein Pmani_009908, partial [Petrolisthes manimaculis]
MQGDKEGYTKFGHCDQAKSSWSKPVTQMLSSSQSGFCSHFRSYSICLQQLWVSFGQGQNL